MKTDPNARYDVLTWDPCAEIYTQQEGMRNRSLSVDIRGLRKALRELREDFGYTAHRTREDSDPSVLVERVDDEQIDQILEGLTK